MIRRITLSPMLFKELFTQLRGSRAALMIIIYVGAALISTRLVYGAIASQLDYGVPLMSAQIGQVLFIGMSLAMQALMVFLAPAITSPMISREHERGSFDLLMATPISDMQLLGGKLIVAMAFVLMLVLAAGPVLTLVLLFGGVEFIDMLRVFCTILITAVVGCSFGLCCSAITRHTASATLLCYVVLISLVGGSLFIAHVWPLMNGIGAAPPLLVAANPLSAMATALAPVHPPAVLFTGSFRPLMLLGLLSQGVAGSSGGDVAPTYRVAAVIYGALTILLLWGALLAIRPRRRLVRDDGIMLAALLGYGLLAYLLRAWWLPGIFPSA